MKKLMNLALSLLVIFTLAGCGAEQSATYSMVTDLNGMTMTDTMTYSAKGDLVYEMKDVVTMDFTGYDEEAKASDMELYASTYEAMCEKAPNGVTMTCETSGDIITVNMDIDFKSADLQELVDNGYIYTTADENGKLRAISFKQSCKSLEATGYTAQ